MIVQQCNCVTVRAHGLSKDIKKMYPYADLYRKRSQKSRNTAEKYDTPGTCKLMRPPDTEGPVVACLLAQFYPGKAGNYWRKIYGTSTDDSAANRLQWFAAALADLSEQLKASSVRSVGFPFRIGCGLAGGNWPKYLALIQAFARAMPHLEVRIYQKV